MRDSQSPTGAQTTEMWISLSVFLTAIALSTGCASFPAAGSGALQEEIDQIVSSPPLDQVNWGIRIVDPERGQILYSRHAQLKFIPASNMKILSTATALSLLGPDYRYRTNLYAVGSIEEGGSVLNGDLVLRASGDPTFSERFFPSAEAPLDSLAQGLWTAGIRTVTGSLVVDVSTWDSTSVPGSWMIGDLPGTSGATGGAFAIAEGVLTVEVTGGREEGTPAQLRWWPFQGDPFVSAEFVTTSADTSSPGRSVHYLPESRRLIIQGGIEAGDVDTIRVSQRDPVRLASAALLHAFERRGIEVRGGSRIAWTIGETVGPGTCTAGWSVAQGKDPDEIPEDPDASILAGPVCPEAIRLAGVTSPPISEIVKAILEPSQNWMTEQLVRTLGLEMGQRGSWGEGFRVQRHFLTQEIGVDTLDIIFRDGSGMSTQNLITPRAMIRILEFMRSSSNAGIFRNALASPGEEESTLRNRLLSLESRVFAKTGTLTHVTSLSGYIFTDSGKELIFSILTNGSGLSSRDVRVAIDEIVEVVAKH